MCGRFTVLTREEIVQLIEDIQTQRKNSTIPNGTDEPRAQARPDSIVEAIIPTGNEVDIATMTWGLQPPWSKKLIFNTRIESALGNSRIWQRAIREGRCILPAATFFEANTVHALDNVANSNLAAKADIASDIGAIGDSGIASTKPRAYEFAMPDGSPCLLASVCEQGKLSVVTTEPNKHVAPVHSRMPLVLRFEEIETWLQGDRNELAQLADRHIFELVRTAERNRSAHPARNANTTTNNQLSLFD